MGRKKAGAVDMELQRKEHWLSQGKGVLWNSLEYLSPPGTDLEVPPVLPDSQAVVSPVISGFTWADVHDSEL
jgi:hypothetical protein